MGKRHKPEPIPCDVQQNLEGWKPRSVGYFFMKWDNRRDAHFLHSKNIHRRDRSACLADKLKR